MKVALIDSKIYKTLGVVCLSEIKNWNLVKGESKRPQAIFTNSEYYTKSPYFGFAFTTANVFDLLNLTVTFLDSNGNKITFLSNQTKVLIIRVKIQIIK